MFFSFRQNNSGGHFTINDTDGLGPVVWIEADDAEQANEIAENLGIYFDGVSNGHDCSCCGDRWYRQLDDYDGHDNFEIDEKFDYTWHKTVYVHYLDGSIARLTENKQ